MSQHANRNLCVPPYTRDPASGKNQRLSYTWYKKYEWLEWNKKAAASLLPMSDAFCQMEILQAPSEHYGLRAEEPELTMLGQLIKQKVGTGTQIPVSN